MQRADWLAKYDLFPGEVHYFNCLTRRRSTVCICQRNIL